MIEVGNQYRLAGRLDGQDVLTTESLLDINIIEQAGTKMPVMELAFKIYDTNQLRYVNEGAPFELSMGSNARDMLDSKWLFQMPQWGRTGKGAYTVHTKGILDANIKWSASKIEISDEKSAIDRLAEVMERAMKVSNEASSEDKMRWIQHGCPNKLHVDDVWLHAHMPGSFPLVAATLEGFRIRDAKKLVSGSPEFKFRHGDSGDNIISFDHDYGIADKSSFLNSMAARGLQRKIHLINPEKAEDVESKPSMIAAMSSKANINSQFEATRRPTRAVTRNVHDNYHQAYLNNLTQLALFSSFEVTVSWKNSYKNIKPLDLVMFTDDELNNESSVESFGGLYVVSKVARRLVNNVFSTVVTMTRETGNSNLGSSL